MLNVTFLSLSCKFLDATLPMLRRLAPLTFSIFCLMRLDGPDRPSPSSPKFMLGLANFGKSNGFRSRVSTTTTGRGVFSCVPPRSANTAIAGAATGWALSNHSNGDPMRDLRGFMIRAQAAIFSHRYS
jgi:hypothetical protein